ncbi:MAG: anthranilate phosphoribosyltransferase, partial [Pseudonocardiales bacterium]|nr:anthranilate phosphoribosyltransferase [Pseudonocardiales bacterium]
DDGLDELTTTTTSRVWLVSGGKVSADRLDPADFQFEPSAKDALRGGDADYNAEVVHRVLAGEPGPVRDAVLLNAAAAIAAFDEVVSSADRAVAHGLPIAADSIDSGSAAKLLQAWVESSQRVAEQQGR